MSGSIYQDNNYKPTTKVEKLQDMLKISLDAYEGSRLEALEVQDLYHNRHFTNGQLATLMFQLNI